MANRKSPSISTVSASPIRGIALLAALLAGSTALCLLANYLDHLPTRPEPLSEQEIVRGRLQTSRKYDTPEIALAGYENYLKRYPADTAVRLEAAALYANRWVDDAPDPSAAGRFGEAGLVQAAVPRPVNPARFGLEVGGAFRPRLTVQQGTRR